TLPAAVPATARLGSVGAKAMLVTSPPQSGTLCQTSTAPAGAASSADETTKQAARMDFTRLVIVNAALSLTPLCNDRTSIGYAVMATATIFDRILSGEIP